MTFDPAWNTIAANGVVNPMTADLNVGGNDIVSNAGVDIKLETAIRADGSTGGILLETGNMAHTSGSSGVIWFYTGDVNESGTFSGNIEFDIGSGGASGTRGDFVFGRTGGGRPIYIYGEDSTTDWVAIKSPGSVADYTITLPAAAPSVTGQALVATTGGVASWATVLTDVVQDLSPQLGGSLDVNNQTITAATLGQTMNITTASGTTNAGAIALQGGASTAGLGGTCSMTGGTGGSTGGSIQLTSGDSPVNAGDIILLVGRDTTDANGDGEVTIGGGVGRTTATPVKFKEATVNGGSGISLKAPDSLTSDQTWTLPDDDPTGLRDRAWVTDSSGVLGLSPVPIGASKQNGTARNTTDVLADDPDLTVTLEPGAIYSFEAYFVVQVDSAGGTTADFKWDANALGIAVNAQVIYNKDGAAATTTVVDQFSKGTPHVVDLTVNGPTGVVYVHVRGVALNEDTSNRTFTIEWAQNVSNASNTRLQLGSYIKFLRLGVATTGG